MKLIPYLFAILLAILVGLVTPTLADAQSNEIDIASSPQKIFFSVSNYKPGDQLSKTLIVRNNGKQDFRYVLSNSFLNGSEKLYNELLLKVNDKNKVLYNGKLKDFNKLESRLLAKNNADQLTFLIEIPYELGNDFQGLGSEFQIKLYAEGSSNGTIPINNGSTLPKTATNIFNFIAAGGAIIVSGMMMQLYFSKRKRKVEQNYVNLD
ncbi:LPXTG cell wall anchor domain-containing protein [Neobacillus sp. GCM10023253]|uniref:LPXTG cell wall anchor domain-containing protein n=1 Tax=Neobacillus sp. GCM10023253 TaxID=3252644 RepID=UPI0036077DC1